MGQTDSRLAFESLLTKTHVSHALRQPEAGHNEVPNALVTVVLLEGTSHQLQAAYESTIKGLSTWSLSPARILDEHDKASFLGDVRFQRAYMDYFSTGSNRVGGNSKGLAMEHLLSGPKPLIYGLFGAFGKALIFLSDAVEVQNAVLVVEGLTLAAVDWDQRIVDMLVHPRLQTTAAELLSPDAIINQVAYDGRFSGIMKSGPGYAGLSHILASPDAKDAILEYVHKLDARNMPRLLDQLSRLSVLLLCASHKPGRPAFDFYLASVPTLVNSLIVNLASFEDRYHQLILAHGTWLLILLAYITQLRPRLDSTLLVTSTDAPEGSCNRDSLLAQFRQNPEKLEGKYLDTQFLRAIRSVLELGRISPTNDRFYYQAARKLDAQWVKWVGRSAAREETLDIRI